MQISDLIIIGRLGNIVTEKGDYPFKANNNFQPIIFDKLSKIFLIIDKNRLRFSSYCFRKEEKKIFVSFDDYFINEYLKKAKRILLAFDPQDYHSIIEKPEQSNFLGYQIDYKSENIGVVVSSFFNKEYEVLNIKLESNKEIMVPFIEEFVSKIDNDKRKIVLMNIKELIEL
ncbi:MAG: hypothetical protein U9N34_03515 [Candidatus Cloacimonadota bacterium]|nr:hypothetical protein [Candidatus Cloacimonadota bacterium]